MNRITPEQVKAAYEKTGLAPSSRQFFARRKGAWYMTPDEACGIGALYAHEHGVPSDAIRCCCSVRRALM